MNQKPFPEFSKKLIDWYQNNKRDLPWRNTKDPYLVWLSEIILQQTQISQGLSYYLKIAEAYPTVFDLAEGDEETLLKHWQGLGYYSRARNLHHTAKYVVNELNGKFPNNFKALKQLKGIGNYTAAAIASFCFDEKVAVVDGNVYRVLSRFFSDDTDISSSNAYQHFFELAMLLIDDKHPDLFNHAIMEFGSKYCKVHDPKCNGCIFEDQCVANSIKNPKKFPVKNKKIVIKSRFLLYLVLYDDNNCYYVQKRNDNDIWGGLYEFFLVETKEQILFEQLNDVLQPFDWFGDIEHINWIENTVQHKLTHQLLTINFAKIKLKSNHQLDLVHCNNLKSLPVSVVIQNFIIDYL